MPPPRSHHADPSTATAEAGPPPAASGPSAGGPNEAVPPDLWEDWLTSAGPTPTALWTLTQRSPRGRRRFVSAMTEALRVVPFGVTPTLKQDWARARLLLTDIASDSDAARAAAWIGVVTGRWGDRRNWPTTEMLGLLVMPLAGWVATCDRPLTLPAGMYGLHAQARTQMVSRWISDHRGRMFNIGHAETAARMVDCRPHRARVVLEHLLLGFARGARAGRSPTDPNGAQNNAVNMIGATLITAAAVLGEERLRALPPEGLADLLALAAALERTNAVPFGANPKAFAAGRTALERVALEAIAASAPDPAPPRPRRAL